MSQDKKIISTEKAPAAIGPYSQAVQAGGFLFTSGQIGLDPLTKAIVGGGFEPEVRQSFANLFAVISAAGLSNDGIVKLTLYVTDLTNFQIVNQVMGELLAQPYPARSTVGVSSLPRGALFEVEAIVQTA